jgi:hypothetical protein
MACTRALGGMAHGFWKPNVLHQRPKHLSWRPRPLGHDVTPKRGFYFMYL